MRRSNSSKSSSNGIVHSLNFLIIKVRVLLVVVFLILSSLPLSASVLSLAYLVTGTCIPALFEWEGRSRDGDATENALSCFNSQLAFPVYLAVAVAVACVKSFLGRDLGGRSGSRGVEWRKGRLRLLYHHASVSISIHPYSDCRLCKRSQMTHLRVSDYQIRDLVQRLAALGAGTGGLVARATGLFSSVVSCAL
jgi:hypothetical protein